jgi:hypothetical protein
MIRHATGHHGPLVKLQRYWQRNGMECPRNCDFIRPGRDDGWLLLVGNVRNTLLQTKRLVQSRWSSGLAGFARTIFKQCLSIASYSLYRRYIAVKSYDRPLNCTPCRYHGETPARALTDPAFLMFTSGVRQLRD